LKTILFGLGEATVFKHSTDNSTIIESFNLRRKDHFGTKSLYYNKLQEATMYTEKEKASYRTIFTTKPKKGLEFVARIETFLRFRSKHETLFGLVIIPFCFQCIPSLI
jgi:hypothetical protein